VDVGRHLNINIIPNTEVTALEGEAGDFKATLESNPRYIDTNKCTGCGECKEVCPVTAINEFDCRLNKRAATYIPYAQAVPLAYTIDREKCIGCGLCQRVCLAEAVDYSQQAKTAELGVGAVILAPGSNAFDPSTFDNYQYNKYPNVITSLEMERILSASGPYQGHLMRPLEREEPKKIAWLQCVGSRDINQCDHPYCSSVCCMSAIKEAVIAKEHASHDLECNIFYMDMRTHGKDFEKFYERAKSIGVKFTRARVHSVMEDETTGNLHMSYFTEAGEMVNEEFDMVVLSVGLESKDSSVQLAEKLGVDVNGNKFVVTTDKNPVQTSRDGVFVCGVFQGPKDIPQSVVEAGAAAAAAGEILSSSRYTATKEVELIPETNVVGERPRVGVFVCSCGINIAGTVDVNAVKDYAAALPYVEYVCNNLYTCSQDTQEFITQAIQENNLNRVVVASCTPKTHEPMFRDTLAAAGLNKYLFEMANIRNQCSWVHLSDRPSATEKSKDLVRMAVTKAALKEPLQEIKLDVNQTAMVVGGGVSGMASALNLSRQGFQTHLIERDRRLGGQANSLHVTGKGEKVSEIVSELVKDLEADPNINIHLNTTIESVEGFVGNFKSTLKNGESVLDIEHGVVTIATGGYEYKPEEYQYGKDPRVITSLEFDRKLMNNEFEFDKIDTAVFIQCVGSREPDRPYCSRLCCSHSIESALEMREKNPDMNIIILNRDIRTYGEREHLYKKAREVGIIFVRYSREEKPEVTLENGKVMVRAVDNILGRPLEIEADLLTLAAAIIPNGDIELAQNFKVTTDDDGFYVERHAKLGPSEFATDGVFMCGLAHYPKPLDESISQAKAAASRAVTLLARGTVSTNGEIASTNPMVCSGCSVCVSICPYSAPRILDEGRFAGKAEINAALCKGCGLCVASCRSGAINLKGFSDEQIFSMVSVANY
jgi:heterodisulfide reductase subunit A2